ncbi:MAG: ATP-binding cassette domain-containing protein, partial [Vicinamibacteria bacterium]
LFGSMLGLGVRAIERHKRELVDDVVETLGLVPYREKRIRELSTGTRRVVDIATVVVQEPKLVLLDEPTSGLDVPSTRAMRDFIKKLRDDGAAVLFSSHIMQEASALCDHIVVMSKGKVVALGSPDELRRLTGKDSLEDAFVAAIGSEEGLR